MENVIVTVFCGGINTLRAVAYALESKGFTNGDFIIDDDCYLTIYDEEPNKFFTFNFKSAYTQQYYDLTKDELLKEILLG